MLKSKLAVLLSVLTMSLMAFAVSVPVEAATSASLGSGNGLTISPLTTNLVIGAGQSETTQVNVQNVTAAATTVQVDINDFTAGSSENGHPQLLLNANQYAPTHSLKRYISPIANITLQAGQQKTVNINIAIPKGAAGGGYYAAIRFTPVTVSGGKTVTLTASVASLVLVRVPGNIIDDLQLASVDARQGNGSAQVIFFTNKNLVAAVRFNNVGNVQEQPFGKFVVKNGNTQIGSYDVNNTTPPGNVLPGSIRLFTVPLSNIGMFGKYTIEGNFGYGTNGQLLSGTTTFYVVPLPAILAVLIVILLIIFFTVVLPRMRGNSSRRSVRNRR